MNDKITGFRNNLLSWERQSFWQLSNGWTAITECSPFYGEMVTALYDGQSMWQCPNGLTGLPQFARSWIEPIVNDWIVRLNIIVTG